MPKREHALLRGSLDNWSPQGITSHVVAMRHARPGIFTVSGPQLG